MIDWTVPVSWHTLSSLLSCPKTIQHRRTKTRVVKQEYNHHAVLGRFVQAVYEQFFNSGLYKESDTTHIRHLKNIIREFYSSWIGRQNLILPPKTTVEDFLRDAVKLTIESLQHWKFINFNTNTIQSEVEVIVSYSDLQLIGYLDFLIKGENGEVSIIDGKTNKTHNADKNQLLFYKFLLELQGSTINTLGFLYYRSGFVSISFTEEEYKQFLQALVYPGLLIFRILRKGVRNLPALPSMDNCRYCQYRYACLDSPYQAKLPANTELEEVVF
jgi:CRISPR/Cas system-associated exonuclease Cas4 (RecB family)